MTKNLYNKCDDVSSVTGVRKCDRLLIIGSGRAVEAMAFMKKYVAEVATATIEELNSEYVKHQYFEKIFVIDYDGDVMSLTHILDRSIGMVTFFIESDKVRENLLHRLETSWYPAESWDLVSNIGKCLITEARGYPRYAEVETRYE